MSSVQDRHDRLTAALLAAVPAVQGRSGPLPAALTRVHGLLTGHDTAPGTAVPDRTLSDRTVSDRAALDQAVIDLAGILATLPTVALEAPQVQDLAHQATAWQRRITLDPPLLGPDHARQLRVLRLNDLRRLLHGRRVCLVTDRLERLAGTGLGSRIDRYPAVVRFGALTADPADGGRRCDLQVLRHDAAQGWDVSAGMLLILADTPQQWVAATRSRMIPGAQRALAEKALRRPLNLTDKGDPQQQDPQWQERPPPATDEPSDVYQMIRLIDVLAVCPGIDLVGFRPETDLSTTELAWLTPRLGPRDDHVIGVR